MKLGESFWRCQEAGGANEWSGLSANGLDPALSTSIRLESGWVFERMYRNFFVTELVCAGSWWRLQARRADGAERTAGVLWWLWFGLLTNRRGHTLAEIKARFVPHLLKYHLRYIRY